MLDSLVRVSRRVGWSTDRFATDPKHPELTQSDAHRRSRRTASSSPQSSERAGPGARRHGKHPRSRSRSAPEGYNSGRRGGRSPSHRASDCAQNRTWHSTWRKCTRRVPSGRGARSVRILTTPQSPTVRAEFPGPTMRIHPFDSIRFHVLLNSLFKVLFNFPSRYLSAIGLVPVFSLRWSLPPTLGCIPKQPDSKEARSHRVRRPNGPDTRFG